MIILLVILGVLTFYLFKFYSHVRTLPPGPFPLPIIGNFHQLTRGVKKYGGFIPYMHELRKKHGDIVTFFMGPFETIQIFDYHLSVEAMVTNGVNFMDRNQIEYIDEQRGGRGIIFSNGRHWHEQRKFALSTLKRFGMGRNIMQDKIMEEFNLRSSKLNKELEACGGTKTIDPAYLVERTVGNIINRIILSNGFTEEKEEQFFALKKQIDDGFEDGDFFDFLPAGATRWYSWLPYFQRRIGKVKEPMEMLIQYMRDQIAERKKAIEMGEHQPSEEGEDFVDAYLIQMNKNKGDEDRFDEETLASTMVDLWVGGQHTTAGTISWALGYILLHPHVLEKLRLELDSVTKRNRQLQLSDKQSTPYLNSTILEVLRLSAISPMNLFRLTKEDTKIGNFIVPKGTAITAQPSVIMSNPKYFSEANEFKPERFLEKDLEQYVVPFGLGKRACLGEAAARLELYLILGNLLLSYDLQANKKNLPQMGAINEAGDLRLPHSFTVTVSIRA